VEVGGVVVKQDRIGNRGGGVVAGSSGRAGGAAGRAGLEQRVSRT